MYYTPQIGDFGSYRIMLGNKTLDGEYISDRAQRTMAVGYRETKEYPYTWDFEDLTDYVLNDIRNEMSASNITTDNRSWQQLEYGLCMRNGTDENNGFLYASGGQLYASKKMFAEAAGLGFKRSVDNPGEVKTLNNSVRVVIGGLTLNNTNNENFQKIVIPQVDDDAYIYVRLTPIAGALYPKAAYSVDGNTEKDFDKTITIDNDVVYIVKNTAKQDVELWLNGVTIKKIGVSRDSKTVNVKGYASESRDHRIDHSLTKFFTGADVKTYVVQAADYENRTLTLFDITSDTAPILAENQGCVLHYTENTELKVIDNQFNLFVPDMHDTGNYLHGTYGNMMKANVAGNKIDPSEGNYTNYILTYKYYQLDKNGNKTGSQQTGDEMFYRVANGGATAKKNSAYLPLLTEKVKPSEKNPTGSAKFTFIFSDFSDDNTPTAIEALSGNEMQPAENAIWYNLNGQKLNGKPTKGGLYIVNGKKVLVK